MAADLSALTQVIQATLAPMFLVSGGAIFLNFTQARLFRVIDRLRAVGKELEHAGPGVVAQLRWQREHQLRRAVILRNAILFGIIVILFTVLTAILLLASDALASFDPGKWPLITFALAMVAFTVALVLVTVDAYLSVAAARHTAREFHEGR
ncbi:MAG: hypothetical protein QOE90_2230 [Thermoplasmata archaeon]|nr:hypothetical protein [Thermoplasmata archaeon]